MPMIENIHQQYMHEKRMIIVLCGITRLWRKFKKICFKCQSFCNCNVCHQNIDDIPLEINEYAIYHRRCYAWLKFHITDDEGRRIQTVKGITMKEYIDELEKHESNIDIEDKNLLKRLTTDTLFCEHCFQPFIPGNIDSVMVSPFRVTLEIVSYVLFIFIPYPVLIVVFVFLAMIDGCTSYMYATFGSKKTHSENEVAYDDYDREYAGLVKEYMDI